MSFLSLTANSHGSVSHRVMEVSMSLFLTLSSPLPTFLSLFSMSVSPLPSLQSCPTLCDPTDGQPTRFPHPWDSPGKNTGVGCHFLLQRMKVKSESEVAQSCQTLSDPMDCSPPGSSVHGVFQARVLEWGHCLLPCK